MTEASEKTEIEYRNQKGRYPWWVKTVDHITTETDREQAKRAHMTKTPVLVRCRYVSEHSQGIDH